MSDNFNARAELEVRLEGIREMLNDLQNAADNIGDTDAALQKWQNRLKSTEKDISGLDRELKKVSSTARAAKNDLSPDSAASKEWQDLAATVEKAETAYKQLALAAAAAGQAKPDLNAFMASEKGVSADDLAKYRQGRGSNLLGDEAAEVKARAAEEARISAQKKKNEEFLAALKRNSLDNEFQEVQRISAARKKAAQQELAAYQKGMASTSVADLDRARNSAPQGRTDAQRNLRGMGVAEWDNQFAAAAANIGKVESSLPRLRYALYDVATTAGIASAAVTGVGIASVAAFASMESSFTNVERTLDNVSGDKVQALRSELVGLTREIPQTFGNISEIATLGNQLGIASGDIAAFTETTAKFSAVTGLTAEASAQAFGSLGELLNVQARDYEALGSSIALVGRRSVATEQEIVAMTTRLAASASNAGFTAQQVIALSGAFASLRIAPERAQGVMEVYFKTLNTAISEGGPRLEAFAKTAGVTTAEVENLVRTDPVAFFERLATGLGQLDQIAQTGALADLGLQGIRAGEVFGRVSANVEVFNSALKDANQGWSEGTELGDQYAKVVDDLASRWQIFLNAVTEAGAAVGASLAPVLGVVLNLLTLMAQGISSINEATNGWLLGPIAFLGALAAGIAGAIAVSALFLASAAAMKTAMAELSVGGVAASFSLRALSGAATQVGVAMGFSTTAIRVFKVALMSTGIGVAVVALGALAAGMYDASQAAGGLSAELQPVADSLARAIEQDTAVFHETGEAIATITTHLGGLAAGTGDATNATRDFAGVQDESAASTGVATQRIEEQTVALGAYSDALIRKHLAEDEGFSDIANDPGLRAAAERAGFTVDELISNAIRSSGGATAYVDEIRAKAQAAHDAANAAIGQGGLEDAETQQLLEYAFGLQQIVDKLSPVTAELDAMRGSAVETGNATKYAGVEAEVAGAGFGEAGAGATEAAEGMWDAQDAAMAIESQLYSLGSSLGENAGMWDIYSEGGRSNISALQDTLDAIAAETPGNTGAIASNFQALYDQLIQGGYATAQQLEFVQQKIRELAGTASAFSTSQQAALKATGAVGEVALVAGKLIGTAKGVKPAARNFSSLFDGISTGAAKAAKAVGSGGSGGGGGGGGGLTQEIRTLLDYAGDLDKVFKRAFDLRFGNQQSLDGVASGWSKIAQASERAREEVEKYQATLAELSADRKAKEYWLMVAENYGDELRAVKLRAELADLNADQAKTQKDLSKAQGEASKTLTGNSDAAISNRETILGMVGSYQTLLKTYAANGMSQEDLQRKSEELKQEFIRQATQMGYSRAEVDLYASSFDDMTLAISRVPRNITVTANANPAIQALAELEAQANRVTSAAGRAGSAVNNIGAGGGSGASALAARLDYMNLAALGAIELAKSIASSLSGNWITAIAQRVSSAAYTASANSIRWNYGFKSGGYTGDGGVSDIAGVVHGKEYVMSAPAVKNAGGPNAMNFLHTMLKAGKFPTAGSRSPSGLTDLSAATITALASAIAQEVGPLSISERSLQGAVNGGNGNAARRRVG